MLSKKNKQAGILKLATIDDSDENLVIRKMINQAQININPNK